MYAKIFCHQVKPYPIDWPEPERNIGPVLQENIEEPSRIVDFSDAEGPRPERTMSSHARKGHCKSMFWINQD